MSWLGDGWGWCLPITTPTYHHPHPSPLPPITTPTHHHLHPSPLHPSPPPPITTSTHHHPHPSLPHLSHPHLSPPPPPPPITTPIPFLIGKVRHPAAKQGFRASFCYSSEFAIFIFQSQLPAMQSLLAELYDTASGVGTLCQGESNKLINSTYYQ